MFTLCCSIYCSPHIMCRLSSHCHLQFFLTTLRTPTKEVAYYIGIQVAVDKKGPGQMPSNPGKVVRSQIRRGCLARCSILIRCYMFVWLIIFDSTVSLHQRLGVYTRQPCIKEKEVRSSRCNEVHERKELRRPQSQTCWLTCYQLLIIMGSGSMDREKNRHNNYN